MSKLQYSILTRDTEYINVANWIKENKIDFEAHLNRTRFWVTAGEEHTVFLLTWGHVCTPVYDDEDLVTGQRTYGHSEFN
jgi:hypothetical protein